MSRLFLNAFLLVLLTSCSSVRVDDYIKSEPRYTRQLSSQIDAVYEAVKAVLERHGWSIASIEDPEVYERSAYDGRVKKKSMLLMTHIVPRTALLGQVYEHLNVYLHDVGQGTDIDIRYESMGSWVGHFRHDKDDKRMNALLDEIEKEL